MFQCKPEHCGICDKAGAAAIALAGKVRTENFHSLSFSVCIAFSFCFIAGTLFGRIFYQE